MMIEISSIAIQLNLKVIKKSHISVLSLGGRGRLSALECMTIAAIRMAVIHRIP